MMNRIEYNPALAARLAGDRRLAARLAHFYAQLRALPRGWRRRLARRARLSLAAAALLLALSNVPALPPAGAADTATITVANGEIAVANNNKCSFIEAINNANDTVDGQGNQAGHDDCASGNPNGADIIALPSGGLFTFTKSVHDYYGYSGLPLITSTITIEGNGATLTRGGANSLRFFTLTHEGDLTLDNLTLRNGDNGYYTGGAIYLSGYYDDPARLTITNSTITGNKAGSGGGIFAYYADITIANTTFSDNTAYNGGAIDSYYSTLSITDSTFSGNTAMDGTGGGLYALGGVATLDGLTVTGNKADTGAGVMLAFGDSATINDTTITGNEAGAGGGAGGGVYLIETPTTVTGGAIRDNDAYYGAGVAIIGGQATFTDTIITGNDAGGAGGAFYGLEAALGLTRVTIAGNAAGQHGGGLALLGEATSLVITRGELSGNTAGGNGGALFLEAGTAGMINSTLSGNKAAAGGAIHSAGLVTLTNVTVSRNTAGTTGGGTHTQAGTLILRRSLLSGNTAPTGREAHRAGGAVTANAHNLFGFSGNAGLSGFAAGATDVVPAGALAAVVDSLADNGGPTQTHALPDGSPAIDAAPSAACAAAPVDGTDQRGEPRNRDGNGAASANECDIGAFEAGEGGQPPPAPFVISVPVILR